MVKNPRVLSGFLFEHQEKILHLKIWFHLGCALVKKQRSIHNQNYLEESDDPDGMQ